MSAPAGLSLVLLLSVLLQDELAQVSEDISNQPALVLGRGHQNQVSENFGDLERYLAASSQCCCIPRGIWAASSTFPFGW